MFKKLRNKFISNIRKVDAMHNKQSIFFVTHYACMFGDDFPTTTDKKTGRPKKNRNLKCKIQVDKKYTKNKNILVQKTEQDRSIEVTKAQFLPCILRTLTSLT